MFWCIMSSHFNPLALSQALSIVTLNQQLLLTQKSLLEDFRSFLQPFKQKMWHFLTFRPLHLWPVTDESIEIVPATGSHGSKCSPVRQTVPVFKFCPGDKSWYVSGVHYALQRYVWLCFKYYIEPPTTISITFVNYTQWILSSALSDPPAIFGIFCVYLLFMFIYFSVNVN